MFLPPWPTFRWWYLTERERGALRVRGTTPLTLLISLFHSTTLLYHPVLSLSERLTLILFACTWFPFPLPSLAPNLPLPSLFRLCPISHPSLQSYLSAPLHFYLYLPTHLLFSSHCLFLNESSKPNNKIQSIVCHCLSK